MGEKKKLGYVKCSQGDTGANQKYPIGKAGTIWTNKVVLEYSPRYKINTYRSIVIQINDWIINDQINKWGRIDKSFTEKFQINHGIIK